MKGREVMRVFAAGGSGVIGRRRVSQLVARGCRPSTRTVAPSTRSERHSIDRRGEMAKQQRTCASSDRGGLLVTFSRERSDCFREIFSGFDGSSIVGHAEQEYPPDQTIFSGLKQAGDSVCGARLVRPLARPSRQVTVSVASARVLNVRH